MEAKKHPERYIKHLISTPFIWANLIWIVVADFILELYHHTCFPLYELPLVERKKYIRIDRHKLSYLNIIEKVACVYCGYSIGWLKYASEIAAQTEKYWCAIKHQNVKDFIPPEHHKEFVEYDDKHAFLNTYSPKNSTDVTNSYSEHK
jgi:hypothetical protein